MIISVHRAAFLATWLACVLATSAPSFAEATWSVNEVSQTSSNVTNRFGVWSLSPNSGEQWQTLNVTLTGSGFVNGVTTADFGPNISVNSVTVTDSENAIANITIAHGSPVGKVTVKVTTRDYTFNLGPAFTVTPIPWGLRPTRGKQGQTLSVAITGGGFVNGVTTADFGPNITVNSVTVTDSENAIANITVAHGAPVGKAAVKVTTGNYTFNFSPAFTVTPTVWSLSPTSGKQGQTLSVAITGGGFVNGVTTTDFGPNVTLNSVSVTDSENAIANITISHVSPVGKLTVKVTTGNYSFTFGTAFTVTPTVWSLSPTSGERWQTLNVAISGAGFVKGVTTADFGPNITVNSVTVADSEDAVANITIARGAPVGKATVKVTTGNYTHNFGPAFTVTL